MNNSLLRPAPLAQTAAGLRSGQTDLLGYINRLCDHIDAVEPKVQALLPEPDRRARLLSEAQELLRRYPEANERPILFGIPIGVKDIFQADGFETRAGSKLPPAALAGPEADSVALLRAAGALVLGKTVTTEFAFFEPGPTRNPHNLAHTPGGSSSGSAAAVAAGITPLALGTQTIGSVIRPAAFCGIVGFKPTYNRIPPEGLLFFSRSADHVDLFTQDVAGMQLAASVTCADWQPYLAAGKPVLGVPAGPYLAQASDEALAAFEEQVMRLAVVAAGVGRESVEAAFRLLEHAAGSRAQATRWARLSSGATKVPPAKPERAVALLKPRWQKQWFDQAVCAGTSPQCTDFTVGYFDGDVHAYDKIGKTLWTRRMPTRVRAIARSLDGAWVGVASYPGLLLLTSQGRPQWAATLDETSRRADFTTLAIAPDGALTVAGTRRGVVYGYDVSGTKVFSIGEADADEAKDGWQSRFGAITAVAISAKTGTVVVGSRLGLVALDAAGQELWSSKNLKGITALRWSYGETQTVALGTRDGTVACLGAGGSILWRAKAGGMITDVCFVGTSQKVLAASLDGTLRCYDRNGKVAWERRSPVGFRFLGTSYDGEVVAAAELSGSVIVCDDTGTLLARTERLEGVPRAWVFSMTGEWLLVGTSAGQVAFFNYRRPRVGQDEL